MLLVSVSYIEDGWERTVYLPHVSAEPGHISQKRTLTSQLALYDQGVSLVHDNTVHIQ